MYAAVSLGYCTASVVRTNDLEIVRDQKALILTAGHWVKFLKNRIVSSIADVKAPNPAHITGEFFPYEPEPKRKFLFAENENVIPHVSRLVYATNDEFDVAVLELIETYGELLDQGIHSLMISKTPLVPGETVRIASGFFQQSFECKHSEQWLNFYAFLDTPPIKVTFPLVSVADSCFAMGGYSGSPVIRTGSEELGGLLFAVATHPVTGQPAAVYISSDQFSSCFDNNQYIHDAPGCKLVKPVNDLEILNNLVLDGILKMYVRDGLPTQDSLQFFYESSTNEFYAEQRDGHALIRCKEISSTLASTWYQNPRLKPTQHVLVLDECESGGLSYPSRIMTTETGAQGITVHWSSVETGVKVKIRDYIK